jgi:hypothetical protein
VSLRAVEEVDSVLHGQFPCAIAQHQDEIVRRLESFDGKALSLQFDRADLTADNARDGSQDACGCLIAGRRWRSYVGVGDMP